MAAKEWNDYLSHGLEVHEMLLARRGHARDQVDTPSIAFLLNGACFAGLGSRSTLGASLRAGADLGVAAVEGENFMELSKSLYSLS